MLLETGRLPRCAEGAGRPVLCLFFLDQVAGRRVDGLGDNLDIFRQPVRRSRTPRAKRHDQQTGPLHGYHDVQIDALVKRQEPSGEGPDMHPAPLCTLWGALKNKARIRMKWRFLLNLYN